VNYSSPCLILQVCTWPLCVCDYVGFVQTPYLLIWSSLLEYRRLIILYKSIEFDLLVIRSATSALFMRFVSCQDEHIEPSI
jgi:hypothetical protein